MSISVCEENSQRAKSTYLVLLAALFLLFGLSGCSREEVASNLDQRQANEIVATLASNGIQAVAKGSQRGGRSGYSVEVTNDSYGTAVSVLHAHDLPRPVLPTFEELTRSQGFLPNTREVEAARLDYALSVQLEEKLRSLPGVAAVKAIVRSNLLKGTELPGASIIIEQLPGISFDQKEIERLVALMIPGATPERIMVVNARTLSRTVTISDQAVENQAGQVIHRPLIPFLSFAKIPEGEYGKLTIVLLSCIGVALVCGAFLGFFFGQSYATVRSTLSRLPGVSDRFEDPVTGPAQTRVTLLGDNDGRP